MKRRLALFVVSLGVFASPMAYGQALPCADAYADSAAELVTSIRVAEISEGTSTVMTAFVRFSVIAVNWGSGTAALGFLQLVDNMIDFSESRGRMDETTAESLRAQVDQLRAVLANCTATPPLLTFNCRSGDSENILLWINPEGSHLATHIYVRSDTYPQGPSDPAARYVGEFAGSPGAIGTTLDDGLANDARYYYAAFTEDASGELSPGQRTFGRPQSVAGAFRWSYTAGGTGRPTIGGSAVHFMTASSAGYVTALEGTPDGGTWPTGFTPASVPSPGDDRPISMPGAVTQNGDPWVIVTSLDGRVRAINESTGVIEWTSPDLGDPVEASVCVMTAAYPGGIDDVVMVGTSDGRGGNRFVGLDFDDGSVIWSFDNGGGQDRIGPIRNGCTVDYGRQRVYFTSEATWRTSRDTVWALALADGSASKVWSQSYPRVNTPVVWSGDSIYVGTDLGDVIAIDVADGSARWTSPYVTGDGPVVGFIFPSSNNRLAFSTTNKVHLLEDQGTTAAPLWQPSIPLANPTVPLVLGDEIVVADAEGQVYDLDATNAQPPVMPFASFGEPGRRTPLGLPYYNRNSKLYGVGTAEGVLYVVEKP